MTSMDYRQWLEDHKDELPEEILQRAEERDSHYSSFLIYLTMGRGRTIRRSYFIHCKQQGTIGPDVEFTKDFKTSDSYMKIANKNDWVLRAKSLDNYIDSKKLYQTLERQQIIEDNSWSDYLEVRRKLADAIHAEENMSPRDLKELSMALRYVDSVGRRVAGLPETIRTPKEDPNAKRGISVDDLASLDDKAKKELEEWNRDRE